MSNHKAVVKHTYDASPEELFKAFTDPEVLKEWYAPEGLTIPEISADVTLGGKHRVVMLAPDGSKHIANGIYKEIIPGKKLVFTWKWEGMEWGDQSVVTVEFFPKEGKTEVVLTHEGLPNQQEVEMHTKGWSSCLVRLEQAV